MKKGTYFFVLGYPEKCVEIELNRKGGMAEELAILRRQVKEQEKEIRRPKHKPN